MCGRYTLKTDRKKIADKFGVEDLPSWNPRYNLGPTQDGLVLLPGAAPGTRTAAALRWGLIPGWTKERSAMPLLINARSETAADKPAFREAFRKRRCLVIADGFFEWSRKSAVKLPHFFTVEHEEPFAMAGLWERWRPPGAPREDALQTFAILTTSANELLAPYHDRMPAIVPPELVDDWLNPLLTESDVVQRLLAPFPALRMAARAVNSRVNNIKYDDPACLEPPPDPADAGAGTKANAADDAQGQLDLGF